MHYIIIVPARLNLAYTNFYNNGNAWSYMQINAQLSPVSCAAVGAAFAYYCLFPLYTRGYIGTYVVFALILALVAALSLFRVLASLSFAGNAQTAPALRVMPLRITALAAGLVFGISAGVNAVQTVSFGIPETEVRGISGVVLGDPRIISGGRAMTTLSLGMSMGANGARTTARGEITVFFPEESVERLREFGRGTEIFAGGILRRGFGGFAASGVTAGADTVYLFSADALHITKTAPPLERFRTGLRLDLTRRFTQSPSGGAVWGGLALALLVGIRDNLDTGLTAIYRDAGCAYILALSGMHLAVLVALISFLLKKPLGLKLATISGACIIAAYCFIVGPLPSLNRAALMYLLGVLAILGMLKRDAFSLLCMAFLIQLAITPQAGFSLSFMLSYLALVGILIIGGSINNIFKGTIPVLLLSPLSVSLGAFIATAGVSLMSFGVLHPVGIIASLIITPLTTVFMLGSLAWLGLDLVLPSFSLLLSRPLALLYSLMEQLAVVAGQVPGIKTQPWLAVALSVCIAALVIWFERRRRVTTSRMEPFD